MSVVYHVMLRAGDALEEVDAALERLRGRGINREAAGMHKAMYVTRADQTVLMVASSGSALAGELRGRAGWSEPGDVPLRV